MKTADEILSEYATWAEKIDGNRRQALINAIEEYAAQFQQEWIDVNNEQPEPGVNVLFFNGYIRMGFKSTSLYFDSVSSKIIKNVTHWQLLPKNP